MSKIHKSILLFLVLFGIVQLIGWLQFELAEREWALIGSMAVSYLIIFLCVLGFARTDKIGLKGLGFRYKPNWKRLIYVGVVIGLVCQLVILVLVRGVSTIRFFEYPGPPLHVFIPLLMIAGPLAGVVEEAAFRGYIQRTIEAKWAFVRAVIITSAMFAIAHVSIYALYWASVHGVLEAMLKYYLVGVLFSLFPMGIFLGYSYKRTGQNLICPASLHAMNNVVGLFFVSYSTYLFGLIAIEYGILISILLIRAGIVAICLYVLLRGLGEKMS